MARDDLAAATADRAERAGRARLRRARREGAEASEGKVLSPRRRGEILHVEVGRLGEAARQHPTVDSRCREGSAGFAAEDTPACELVSARELWIFGEERNERAVDPEAQLRELAG